MSIQLLTGDCRDLLKTLPDESVHCCVTSPPYFGLRDYGTAQWEGGDTDCDHSPERRGGRFATPVSAKQASNNGSGTASQRDCPCGARRIDSQIGLEQTPQEYVEQLVSVFREVRRVLRKDGTVWLNLGDSYGGPKGNTAMTGGKSDPERGIAMYGGITFAYGKPKDLIGIPWRVAFALQADGWWLRQDIIWSKPNPMPESVTDRCTKAHEYIFLLTKSARYFYDAEAIAEQSAYPFDNRALRTDTRKEVDPFCRDNGSRARTGQPTAETRNKRSVWTVATQPYSEAHFATFPPALIEPCIKAGCPNGGTMLDPFAGAGTTGLVADRLGRNAIMIELNPQYADLAKTRITDDAPLFAEWKTESVAAEK